MSMFTQQKGTWKFKIKAIEKHFVQDKVLGVSHSNKETPIERFKKKVIWIWQFALT